MTDPATPDTGEAGALEEALTADTIAARALYATPVVDLFEEVRRWVASIGSMNLDTGRRVTKADALLVIDRVLDGFR